MELGHVLTIIGIVIGTVLAATQVPLPLWLSVPLVVFVFLCLWASVVISTPIRCARLRESLREDRYVPAYHLMVGWLTDAALRWVQAERPTPDERTFQQIVGETVVYRLLDRALLIAVVYPYLLLAMSRGLSGEAVRLGEYEVVPAADAHWKHSVTLGGLVLVAVVAFLDRRAAASPKQLVRNVSGWLTLSTLMLLAIGYLVIGTPGAIAVAVAVAVAGAIAAAVAVAVAVAFAGAFAFAVAFLARRGSEIAASAVAICAPAVALWSTLIWLDWAAVPDEARAIYLFLGVLPLVNAIFDFLSYTITLILMQFGLRKWAFALGFVDAIIALLLFLALGATLVVVVATMEHVTGAEFLDLGGLLARGNDWQTYWWVYAMVFSTALPTLAHLVAASLSLSASAGPNVREWLNREIESARSGDLGAGLAASGGVGVLWFLCIAGPCFMLLGAMWWGQDVLAFLLGAYRDWLLSVAIWIGVSEGPL